MPDSPPFRCHDAVIIQIILSADPTARLAHVPAGAAFDTTVRMRALRGLGRMNAPNMRDICLSMWLEPIAHRC